LVKAKSVIDNARFLQAVAEDDAENETRAALEGMVRIPQEPLFRALLETGGRWSEIRRVTWGDIDFGRRLLVIQAAHAKARRQRVIPLRRDFGTTLLQLRAQHESLYGRLPTIADSVFLSPEGCPWGRPTNNIARILARVLKRAGIPKVDQLGMKIDVHALRTTFASRLARSGAPLTHAQRLLGHSDPKLTMAAYTRLDAEDLRGAIESVPSLGGQHGKRRAR
jgi:integrase